MRTKKYITAIIPIFAFSIAFAADWNITEDETITATKTYDNVNYEASATVTGGKNVGLNVNQNLTVGEGVDAAFSSEHCLYLNASDGTATLSGAGQDVSSFTFTGYHFSSKRGAAPYGCQVMTIKDITYDYNGRYGVNGLSTNGGYLRAGKLVLDAATVNLNEGVLAIYRDSTDLPGSDPSIVLQNASKLIIGTVPAQINTREGSITSEQKVMSLSGGSLFEVKADTFDMSNFKISADNSAIKVNSLTSLGDVSLINSTLEVNGTAGSSSSTLLTLSGTNIISGEGSFTFKTSESSIGSTNTYLTASTFNGSLTCNNAGAMIYVGVDDKGVESKVQYFGRFQFNSGAVEVRGASIIGSESNRNNFNLQSSSTASYIGTGVQIYAVSSRINNGYIDGSIDVNGVTQTGDGWDYALSFGVYSTQSSRPSVKASVELGKNASVNVAPSDATSYFALYGDIVSNAGTGKLVSSANAPLTIYDSTVLTLNSTDAFAVGGAATQAESTFNVYTDAKAKIVVNADNNIGKISLGNINSMLTLDVSAGNVLTVGSIVNADNSPTSVVLGEILKGDFIISDMAQYLADYSSQDRIYFLDEEGSKRILGTNLYIEELESASGAYTIYTAIPEPAELAAIFGALALMFAFRRRK